MFLKRLKKVLKPIVFHFSWQCFLIGIDLTHQVTTYDEYTNQPCLAMNCFTQFLIRSSVCR